MESAIFIALVIVSLVLACVDEVRAQGQNLTAWAVIALAAAVLFLHLVT